MENDHFKKLLVIAEYPFIRENMTEEEYKEEYDYLIHNYDKVRDGTYKPLWKQQQEAKTQVEDHPSYRGKDL